MLSAITRCEILSNARSAGGGVYGQKMVQGRKGCIRGMYLPLRLNGGRIRHRHGNFIQGDDQHRSGRGDRAGGLCRGVCLHFRLRKHHRDAHGTKSHRRAALGRGQRAAQKRKRRVAPLEGRRLLRRQKGHRSRLARIHLRPKRRRARRRPQRQPVLLRRHNGQPRLPRHRHGGRGHHRYARYAGDCVCRTEYRDQSRNGKLLFGQELPLQACGQRGQRRGGRGQRTVCHKRTRRGLQ